jgi:hypothetical protein
VLDLVDLDPDLADAWREYLPRFQFLLDDLVRVDERALRERPLTHAVRITLLLLKIAPGNPRLVKDLWPWWTSRARSWKALTAGRSSPPPCWAMSARPS